MGRRGHPEQAAAPTHRRTRVKRLGLVAGFAILLSMLFPQGGVLRGLKASALSTDPSVVGSWAAPVQVGVIGIHAVVLHTGQVLLFDHPETQPNTGVSSDAKLLDPLAGTVTDVTIPLPERNILCGGMSVLTDGRVLVTGGMLYQPATPDVEDTTGTTYAMIFDPVSQTWSDAGTLNVARWYPSNLAMPDGTSYVFGGQQASGQPGYTVEHYDPAAGTFTLLTPTAYYGNYPRMSLLADGRVIKAGPSSKTRMFNPTTGKLSSSIATMNYGSRDKGAFVLLPGGERILAVGGITSGATAPTNTAEIIDFSSPTPTWRYTGSLSINRMNNDTVLLADGSVLTVGGGQKGSYSSPVYTPELYNVASGTWTEMAPAASIVRSYHSAAVLLPDGRVLSSGSDASSETLSQQETVQIFSPPYLFRGARPTIQSAPATATYGQNVTIQTPDTDITSVALVRPAAGTHTQDTEQRYDVLPFSSSSGQVTATIPSSAAAAPPGYYMLFLINSSGVPSIASWVKVG